MRRFAVALLATAGLSAGLGTGFDRAAFAAPPDAARLEALEKENAALRREIARLRAQSARPGPSPVAPPATSSFAKAPVYKAPPPVIAAGWSGLYLGGNVGLSVARNWSEAPFVVPGGTPINYQFSMSPVGAVAGGQIGHNWQLGRDVVAGIEADFQWSGQRDSTTCLNGCDAFGNLWTFTQKLTWFGTARARLGWTNGPALFYATGGFAHGSVRTDFNFNFSFGGSAVSGSVSRDKSGWTAGGGVEAQLAGNWTGKIEYLYVDLGTVSGFAIIPAGSLAGATVAFSSEVRDHIVRAGVNYQLAPDPLVALY